MITYTLTAVEGTVLEVPDRAAYFPSTRTAVKSKSRPAVWLEFAPHRPGRTVKCSPPETPPSETTENIITYSEIMGMLLLFKHIEYTSNFLQVYILCNSLFSLFMLN